MVTFDHTEEIADALASLSAVAQDDLVYRIEGIVRDPQHRGALGDPGYKLRWFRFRGFLVGFIIDEAVVDVERTRAVVLRMPRRTPG